MNNDLKNSVKKGVIWALIERVFMRSFSFIRVPILAYLLSPHDFGLFGIITTVMSFVDVLTRTGFQPAIIQKRGDIDGYLDVTWTLTLLKGFLELIILWILIVPISKFYSEPTLVSLFLTASFVTVIGGFASVRIAVLFRTLELGVVSRNTIIVNGLNLVITVVLAYWLRNIWALVFGLLTQAILTTIGSYVIAPYRPHFDLNINKAKELWSFGKWELLSGVFITAFMHGDDLFVGKVLGVTALGFYAMAYHIGNIVVTELVDSLRKVFFPAFSAIQDDVVGLRKAYLSVYLATAAIGGIFAVGLNLLAPEFVHLIFSQKWYPMIPTLKILAIWGGFQMLSTTNHPLFRAVNRPDWFAKVQAVKLTILIITIYPFSIWWGITGTAFAVLLASMMEIPIGLSWTRQALACKYKDILVPLLAPFPGILVVTILYRFLQGFIHLSNILHLLFFGSVILVLYAMVTLMMDRLLKTGLWSVIQSVLKR